MTIKQIRTRFSSFPRGWFQNDVDDTALAYAELSHVKQPETYLMCGNLQNGVFYSFFVDNASATSWFCANLRINRFYLSKGVMLPSFPIIVISVLLLGPLCLIEGKPTIYMKNENDKLEPVLLPVSSTVIPIPIGYYQQVSAGVGVHNGKLTKQKIKLTKPSGPTKLITVTGLKKMAAHEIKN